MKRFTLFLTVLLMTFSSCKKEATLYDNLLNNNCWELTEQQGFTSSVSVDDSGLIISTDTFYVQEYYDSKELTLEIHEDSLYLYRYAKLFEKYKWNLIGDKLFFNESSRLFFCNNHISLNVDEHEVEVVELNEANLVLRCNKVFTLSNGFIITFDYKYRFCSIDSLY